MSFYSLHNHTSASNIRFLDSINRPSEMIKKAIKLGFGGIAFTDHESLSAAVEIIKERDKIKKDHPDFKIIFGNEIYLIDESEVKNANKYYHFILLAKDKEGWDQLRELSSFAWENSYVEKGQVRVPTTYQKLEEVISKNPGHIFASSACLGSRLDNLILEHNVPETNNFIRWCIKVFGIDNFALELQPSDSEEQIAVNKVLIKLARHYNLPFIVTTDSHYLDKEDFKIHSAFLNSKQTSDRETEKFYKYTYIMTEQEMINILTLGVTKEEAFEAINNTSIIGEKIQEYDFRHGTIVPKIRIPEFKLANTYYNKGYEFIDFYYKSEDEQDRYLMYQIEQGIINKNISIGKVELERINYELDILKYISERLGQSLSAYFNLTVNIVNLSWKASLSGCGRGSACGEYINYLIGITQVNPLDYDLPAWRFLNKERAELPDIDVDFQPEKTAEIIKILREEYGNDHVLNCATFKTESLKSAILSCGRGLGYNNDDMQALAAIVPAHRGHTYTFNECLNGDEEKGFEPVKDFESKLKAYPGLFEAVQKIEGLPTNASIHASALYIFNDGYLPQNSLMRAPNRTPITAFSMHDSDDMGALKMDILRTDAQSKMAKCLELLLKDKQIEWQGSLRATYEKYLHPDVINFDNPEMWKQMADGSIPNLFQMDSPVGAVAMKKARPENVRQLAEVNSIMRLQSETGEQPIDRYVRFRNDINQWYLEMVDAGLTQHEINILEKYLSKSNGVSGSQEVLMQILMDPEICGFTLGEANNARRAISKKIAAKIIQLKKDFYTKGEETSKK
ncbi:MAG: DNA polymerase III subunit alpha [Methanobrevibacter sp.]|nr:DNA polymerase III subunit alpha [Methanobrevibacter sp.]MBP5470138.1 DNA polymerase III subunit alpha [Candidatus Riflebacteria bacterium]